MTDSIVSLESESPEATRLIGKKIATILNKGDVIILKGDLGAGKTQFVKGVAEALGVKETVVSPTFIIAAVYEGKKNLIHIDAYRLESFYEVSDLGLDEDFSQAITVIEWGDRVVGFMENVVLTVEIEYGTVETMRKFKIFCKDTLLGSQLEKLFK